MAMYNFRDNLNLIKINWIQNEHKWVDNSCKITCKTTKIDENFSQELLKIFQYFLIVYEVPKI